MPVQKIKSGRIITVEASTYVGEKGIIFYDEDTPELRLSDGITPGGILFTGGSGTGTYTLVTATNVRLGGIKVGSGLSITGDGTLSAIATSTYVLNTATNSLLGGIKVGSGLSITGDGTLSAIATSTYILPTASTTTLGGVKVGNNLYIDNDGTLNATTATGVADAFKTIVVQGSTNLVASGNDTIEFIAGASISIVSSATSSPYKSVTISVSEFIGNLDGGSPDTIYGGTVNIDGGTV